MVAIESWIKGVAAQPQVHAFLDVVYRIVMPPFLQSRERVRATSFGMFALADVERIAQTFVWFVLITMLIYTLSLRWFGKPGLQRYSYQHPIREPDEKFSLLGGLKYAMPKSFYKHPSFKIDMIWLPFGLILNFLGLLGITLGAGVVQGWLLHRFGPSVISLPVGAFAITLQVIIILLARDFGRFMWHYQGHSIPFFWEFHKGHHSAEVLHPFGVRTHPVDMFIRNTYLGAGGAVMSGILIYLLGMQFSVTAGSVVATIIAVSGTFEHFEHSHVRLSFGKTLDRYFYAPYMHHFHHGARPEHMNVNLGITGGLILWDHLFGTLYRPKAGEQVVWGASMEELGENNPHRTLWGFFSGPFIEAFRTLKRPSQQHASPDINPTSLARSG